MPRKSHNVELVRNGAAVHSYSAVGGSKSRKAEYIRAAMRRSDEICQIGESVEIWFQIDGARNFARFAYVIGTVDARLIGSAESH